MRILEYGLLEIINFAIKVKSLGCETLFKFKEFVMINCCGEKLIKKVFTEMEKIFVCAFMLML